MTASPLSSLTPHSLHPFSRKPHSSSLKILSSTSEKSRRAIGNLQPPWQVPAPPHTPSRSGGPVFEQHLTTSHSCGVPVSLRLLQLKKKRDKLVLTTLDPSRLGPAGTAVWTLACLLEDLQRSALSPHQKDLLASISRENRYSLVWLFHRVFSSSPDLALNVIVLTANFMAESVDRLVSRIGSMLLEPQETAAAAAGGDLECWSNKVYKDYKKTVMAYEHMIVTEKRNSMVLSNYAQLLYEYEKDFDRAGHYFMCAVRAEPADPEAMSRYAMFLWHARGDVDGAEEMFEAAMRAEEEPSSSYHRCNYVRFLLKTGRTDICYSVEECPVEDDDVQS